MQTYVRLCDVISKVLIAVNLVGLIVILVNLTLQVFTRYVLDAPMQATDEIAQNALTWLAFLGAAFLYRERGHIEVDFFVERMPRRAAAVIATVMEVLVVSVMILLIEQTIGMADTMSRVMYGTLLISKFHLQFVPAFISAVCTVLFAIEHLIKIWRGDVELRVGFQL